MHDFLKACEAAVYETDIQDLATRMDMRPVNLLRRANVSDNGTWLNIKQLHTLTMHTGDIRPLKALAGEFGYSVIQERAAGSTSTKDQVVSAMYEYLIKSWDELPDSNKRALGFDSVAGSAQEEEALHRLTRMFMEYAEISCTRALAARRRRLATV